MPVSGGPGVAASIQVAVECAGIREPGCLQQGRLETLDMIIDKQHMRRVRMNLDKLTMEISAIECVVNLGGITVRHVRQLSQHECFIWVIDLR